MIIVGCMGLGLWYRHQLTGRLEALRNLIRILEQWMSEIRFGKATLPECCRQIATRCDEPMAGILLAVYQEFAGQKGACFSDIFCGHMREGLQSLPLKKKDLDAFLDFSEGGGFEDCIMQLKALEQSRERLQQTVDELQKEYAGKCRMAVGLGTMSGLLLVIVLL